MKVFFKKGTALFQERNKVVFGYADIMIAATGAFRQLEESFNHKCCTRIEKGDAIVTFRQKADEPSNIVFYKVTYLNGDHFVCQQYDKVLAKEAMDRKMGFQERKLINDLLVRSMSIGSTYPIFLKTNREEAECG